MSGADAKLFADATQVVLMREGTRTVLSMQNDYQGPPADFAMVVPVPVVLQKANVKTLPREIFEKVDALSAPRLVEYWEQDPCGSNDLKLGGGGGPIQAGRVFTLATRAVRSPTISSSRPRPRSRAGGRIGTPQG